MVERTLSERELNRALLARQLLLERADLPLPRAIERVGGIQSQYAPSAYIGLWTRVAGFRREQLTSALERRRVVQGTLMRSTIHIVSRRDYPLFAAAVREHRRRWWLRASGRRADAAAMAATARRVRSFLADGPRRRAEIARELGLDSSTWNAVGLWVDLVRVPPSGTWDRRSADLYALADDWLGPATAVENSGIDLLIRRYLGAFGPATRKDIASFTGLSASALAKALGGIRLRRFRTERGEDLLDLPRAPLPDAGTPAPVRFLPVWDATLLVHARRTQILPEAYRSLIFNTRTPHSMNTFLVDGQVAGSWKVERGRVEVTPFARPSREARRELDEETDRLAEWLG